MRVEVILKNINELECLEGLDEYEVKVERKMSLRLKVKLKVHDLNQDIVEMKMRRDKLVAN